MLPARYASVSEIHHCPVSAPGIRPSHAIRAKTDTVFHPKNTPSRKKRVGQGRTTLPSRSWRQEANDLESRSTSKLLPVAEKEKPAAN